MTSPRIDALKHPDPGLLNDIGGDFFVAQIHRGQPEKSGAVAVNQGAIGGLVALAEGFDQVGVVGPPALGGTGGVRVAGPVHRQHGDDLAS